MLTIVLRASLCNKYKLVAFDIDTKKLNDVPDNVFKATSVKDIAEQSNLVLTCLPKPEHVLEVVDGKDGLLKNSSKGMVWIDTSTTNFKQTKKLSNYITLFLIQKLKLDFLKYIPFLFHISFLIFAMHLNVNLLVFLNCHLKHNLLEMM